MSKKIRLDKYLADNNLSDSREKAKREIISGWIKVNNETVRNPAKMIIGDENISIERPKGLFVSRGGYKLSFAVDKFKIKLNDLVAVDLGASTGGFTDCLLKNGAKKVYAIDVGYGQLDYSLRNDDRVVVKERTNARNLTSNEFKETINIITADLSFISFAKVYVNIKKIFVNVDGIVLLKPQFEAESSEHKKGIVTKKEKHIEILKRVLTELIQIGIKIKGLTFSPIKGPKGNIEFLLYFNTENKEYLKEEIVELEELISDVVSKAHNELDNK